MKFTKMEGLGNDYVYINCFSEKVENPEKLAIAMSDRHFGVGSDGVILIKPSDKADFTMDMYNADGSRSEMCGNGIRCVGKYVYDYGLTDKTSISVETLAGIKYLDFVIKDGKVDMVTVDMGAPILKADQVPVRSDKEQVIDEKITVAGVDYHMTCVSMGNPHAVVWVNSVKRLDLAQIGPEFEYHGRFPRRVNVEFAQVVDREHMIVRVWERGAGETLACGTGACAVAAAGVLNDLTERHVTVKLKGGELSVLWDEADGKMYMTGPAVTVYDGIVTV